MRASKILKLEYEGANFQKIGYETAIANEGWAGPVVATKQALYCALVARIEGRFAILSGIVAALRGHGDRSALNYPMVVPKRNVPEGLGSPDFGPLGRLGSECPVLVISRAAVHEIIKRTWINNTLRLRLGEERIVITHRMFSPSKVRDYLVGAGWPLTWRGEHFNMELERGAAKVE